MTRAFLRIVARALAGVLLVAQLAISAYACPILSRALDAGLPASASEDSARASTPECSPLVVLQSRSGDAMAATADPGFANLCLEHCRSGQQSDQAPTLNLPTVLLSATHALAWSPNALVTPQCQPDRASASLAAGPPHAVLHCVYRL